MHVLVAGCGYLGLALGARLTRLGHVVDGLRRPGGDPQPLFAAGIHPLFADLSSAASLSQLPATPWDGIVYCAAPAEGTETAYRAVYVDGTRRLLENLAHSRASGRRPFVFVSSTAVYGQTDGSAVDEDAATVPADFGGRILLEAEAQVRESAGAGLLPVVLRAAGIYGPGRNRLGAFLRGEARIPGDGRRWMNLIHRDDLASAILQVLAGQGRETGAVYNIADDHPPTGLEFHQWLAEQLALPVPAFASDTRPAGRRSRTATNKRVLNARARRELGWQPAYPDFRTGYRELLADVLQPPRSRS